MPKAKRKEHRWGFPRMDVLPPYCQYCETEGEHESLDCPNLHDGEREACDTCGSIRRHRVGCAREWRIKP
jgi:hypothetical protein